MESNETENFQKSLKMYKIALYCRYFKDLDERFSKIAKE